jgi:hypothetical protein
MHCLDLAIRPCDQPEDGPDNGAKQAAAFQRMGKL